MLNLHESTYFKSLSKHIQDTVVKSNRQFNDETELRQYVRTIDPTHE